MATMSPFKVSPSPEVKEYSFEIFLKLFVYVEREVSQARYGVITTLFPTIVSNTICVSLVPFFCLVLEFDFGSTI